jgi:hypothetical protein
MSRNDPVFENFFLGFGAGGKLRAGSLTERRGLLYLCAGGEGFGHIFENSGNFFESFFDGHSGDGEMDWECSMPALGFGTYSDEQDAVFLLER